MEALGRLPVSAASGLVALDGALWVIADDSPELAGFEEGSLTGRSRLPLVDEAWPEPHAARKQAKADFEALCAVADRVLLAVGSGSRPSRCRAVAVDVRTGTCQRHDLTALYASLKLPDLNIEGAAVVGDTLRLLQRGNGAGGVNAVIDLGLETMTLRRVHRVDLGAVDGVRWGFTDASPLGDGRLVFAAAAEAGDDVYHDGACVDSAIGILDASGEPEWLRPLGLPGVKIEGIQVTGDDVLMVSDADDPTRLTTLYRTRLSRPD